MTFGFRGSFLLLAAAASAGAQSGTPLGFWTPAKGQKSAPAVRCRTAACAKIAAVERQAAAVELRDGRVLITGGRDQNGARNDSEIFDPESGATVPTAAMMTARSGHTATRLFDGRVLIAGGDDAGSAEIYDPDQQTFSPAGRMTTARWGHAAMLLPDNYAVLIAGGRDAEGTALASAEIYFPRTGKFEPAAGMAAPHDTATLRAGDRGEVLISGGAAEAFHFPTVTAAHQVAGSGWQPGETIRLEFGGQQFTVTAGADGSFTLPALLDGTAPGLIGFARGSAWQAEIAHKLSSTTTISSYTCGGPYGQDVYHFQAAVDGSGADPTGTVTLYAGSAAVASAAVSNSQASLNWSGATPADYSMSVTYSGDYLHIGSSSKAVPCIVTKGMPTGIVFTDLFGAIYGQPVGVSMSIKPNANADGTFYGAFPGGSVQFYSNGSPAGQAAVSVESYTASFAGLTESALAVGTDTLTGTYLGDSNFASATAGSTSIAIVKAPTVSSLSVTAAPVHYDQPVTVSYQVSAAAPSTAVVQGFCGLFLDGTLVGSTSLDANGSGTKSFPTGLAVGSHTFALNYLGNGNFDASTQSATLNVGKDSPSVLLSTSGSPSQTGQSVTFTAAVIPLNPAQVTGSVAFKDGSQTLSTVALNNNGTASLTTSALATGNHTITASYGGDGNFNTGSASTSQTVKLNCDLNGDTYLNVGDVQRALNEALGEATEASDLNQDGAVNVLDVQLEINYVLHASCGG